MQYVAVCRSVLSLSNHTKAGGIGGRDPDFKKPLFGQSQQRHARFLDCHGTLG